MVLTCSTVSIESTGAHSSKIDVDLNLDISDIIDQLGADKLLDEIGENAVIEHFEIQVDGG